MTTFGLKPSSLYQLDLDYKVTVIPILFQRHGSESSGTTFIKIGNTRSFNLSLDPHLFDSTLSVAPTVL